MALKEAQYGLRGINPYNWRNISYEVETPEGVGVVDQLSVDNRILYDSILREVKRSIDSRFAKKSKDPQQPLQI